NCAVMVSLDLSAAFDTINHQMLIDRFEAEYDITRSALSWFQSYFSNRSQGIKL
ncbi:hypothetical protein HELRODRAFT_147851, partial [Helobdella robusta]|uniref:Reverse transcriptase domain-containing protein n=1 Tax=Helobdella robusta TaxID=6412 RepID=T1EK30_HELRO